jgi:ferric iron reductase protein FhuF
MTTAARSPVEQIYDALRALNASWSVDVGRPEGPGWVAGDDLRDASAGPFNALLLRIGERSKTTDRRTIAALFALRYGWASAMAIAPYLRHGCVPDIALENVSFKFKESTFFERTAIHQARGFMAATAGVVHPTITPVDDDEALLRSLRSALAGQAAPVVDALYRWAGFAPRGTWGMLTSSWASHFTGLVEGADQRTVLPTIERFFAGEDVVALMQPRLHAVTCQDVTHLFQRRASCCRWYLLPQGELCASCPLVFQDERLLRNRAWMQTQLERQGEKRGHS